MGILEWLGLRPRSDIEVHIETGMYWTNPDGIEVPVEHPTTIGWYERQRCYHVPLGSLRSALDKTRFPPRRYTNPTPKVGMGATIFQEGIKWAAVVEEVKAKSVSVRLDYKPRVKKFTLRKDGQFREADTGPNGPIIYFGIQETNIVERKQWYSERDLDAGPVVGIDVRDHLPSDWRDKFSRARQE